MTLKGRQALLLVYRHVEINEDAGVIPTLTDFMAVKWRGDDKWRPSSTLGLQS